MGEHILSVLERVAVALEDAKARGRPAQVHQAEVAERLASQLSELGLAVGAQRRFADGRLDALVPGDPPPVAVQCAKTRESAEAIGTDQVLERRLTTRAVAEQPAHIDPVP